ncbi:MAG: endolytic transglycosylase MltG [Candidatus Saccharibacteria bacterium]|nr:endolytic transglycosylase MltG [Candidatus Saccharibacteria bacterium]
MKKSRSRIPRRLIIVGALLVVLLVGAVVVVRHAYNQSLKPVSNSQQTQIVTIASGSSVKQISKQLADQKLIQNAWVFEWYVHSKELGDQLQAGTYAFSPSEGVPQIVSTLTQGKVTTRLVTILPGRRIDQVRADLINDGFSVASVDAALKPDQYRDLPVMSYVPAGTKTLEGMLYPDSFQRLEGTDPSLIIRESLKEMGDHLPSTVQAAFASKGLTVFQGITLASIVEKEVSKPSDRPQVAQVFLLRLKQGMSLGSDVTALYGSIAAGKNPSLSYDSPYNTRIHTGLPVGPISTVSEESLQAVANPANTSWLYFVSGDDGTTYFEQTYEQHQADAQQHCHELCGN